MLKNTLIQFFYPVLHHLKLMLFRIKWRRNNPDNNTVPVVCFPTEKVVVGRNTYGPLKVISFGNEKEKLIIGNWCSISNETTFLLSGEHNYKLFTNYPFECRILKNGNSLCKGTIVVEDDVWIGYGAIILSGVKLGKGCIVGAGSVVRNDIPPYGIFAGDKLVKYRFEKEVRNKLENNVDFNKLHERLVKDNSFLLSQIVKNENLDEIIKALG